MLRSDVVVEGYFGKGGDGGVGGGDGLAVSDERGDDDEVLGGGKGFVGAEEPLVIADEAGVPGRVEDWGEGGVALRFVGDPGGREGGAGLEFEVSQIVLLVFWGGGGFGPL